ncbi:MAG: glucose-6-phosphate dehydrogenase, partial [Verrucomicrobiia bacterium]
MQRPTPSHNPLREGVVSRPAPQPCSLVIFGATGDLTHRKLVPALYNLAADGDLPPGITVFGFARRPKNDEDFRAELRAAVKKFSRQGLNPDLWEQFASSIHYHQSEFGEASGYHSLRERLDALDAARGVPSNRLFYLAAAPEQFGPILEFLRQSGLNTPPPGVWARIVVEKPFGKDLPSARALNDVVESAFAEKDTYR